jgi:hypothetical protein
MGTNVYCALCEREVGKDDSFVVETPDVVQAFHYDCGHQIWAAMTRSLGRDRARGRPLESERPEELRVGDGTRELVSIEAWKQREMSDRLDALEDLTKRVSSVWRLWLSDAESGSICPGTFDAMKNLLGIEEA